ncbi:MAG: DUF11 domain-containing protein [Candidatus Pacebacteria bacterium]|nr:DUF11 domain-containing protein [Candidatus Paceibacterota bacterium]
MKHTQNAIINVFMSLVIVLGAFLFPLSQAKAENGVPSVSISASPSTVCAGQQIHLIWSSTDATVVNITNVGSVPPTGERDVTLNQTTTFTITGTNSSGVVATAYVTGTVMSGGSCTGPTQLPTVTISANPSSISYGGSSTVIWSSTNATSCVGSAGAFGWSGGKNTSGTFPTGVLTGTTPYNITCTNSAGSANASAIVYVSNQTCQDTTASNYGGSLPCTYPPQLCQDPSATNYHGTLPCQYYQQQVCNDPTATNYRGALPCQYYQVQVCNDPSATNYRGALPCQYYQVLLCNDPSATNYRGALPCQYPQLQICNDVSAINYRGVLPCRYNTVINNQPTVTIYADDTSVAYNGATFIRWSTANATSCYGTGGSVGWAGTKSIGPASFYTGSLTSSRTYSITCTNGYGSISNSATVNVRGQSTTVKTLASSLVIVSSSVDRNQPIVPTLDNTNPRPGDEITYTVSYQNVGTTSVTNLTLQISLPSEVDYMFSNPNNPFRNGNNLTFNLGTLRAGAQGSITIRVKVRENINPGTVLNFPAILSYTDVNGQTQTVSANVSAQVWRDGNEVGFFGANAFGSGFFLPSNIFGWLLLIVLVLILIALGRYLYDQTRPRYVERYLAAPVPPTSYDSHPLDGHDNHTAHH